MMFFNKSNKNLPKAYSENSKGDFYAENGVCTSCGAPQVEAPDLIEHSKFEYGHCYFKKQPITDDEIDHAINAIVVSCISGLRYGGSDEKILKRLYEIGENAQCDQKPKGNYKTIIWDTVIFKFNGSITELSELITTQMILKMPRVDNVINNYKLKNDNYFEFIHTWINGTKGNVFKCYLIDDNKFRIQIEVEKNGVEISTRGNSILLNSIISLDKRISKITWFDKDKNTYDETELK